MQPYRITTRTIPHVCKAARPARNMFTTPFFPHFGPASADFAPLFRLLDSAAADLVPSSPRGQAARRTFTPRFDVREIGTAYELQGELPGIEQEDLEIDFVDERTLVIRGKTASESTKTNEDAAVEPTQALEAGEAATAHTASEKSAKFQKASVEDEYVDAGAESATEGTKTPNTITEDAAPAAAVAEPKKPAELRFKYWLSERSVGEFERRFSFPGRVDQDAVKASLRNGILSVVVPKVVAKEARRIEIQ
ncbi:hypothetical protein OEA41_004457 [Lepraria neglecta]|uniref:SHSP domain-containing protein n=1 Tax=Lepraria neglecta TaxID=209136 RepID=A0AAE0DFT0_9LECA|nr:hypothetical protein OEA41_004457 [Lepraria neglecta]